MSPAQRRVPMELVAALRRVRAIEGVANTGEQARRAAAGSNALILAAVQAGWRSSEIAAAIGTNVRTVNNRVRVAGITFRAAPPALVVPRPAAPPPPTPSPLDVLRVPLAERHWLTLTEAAAHVGRSKSTIRYWRTHGVLPNSRPVPAPVRRLYSRADLDRVQTGPRHGSVPDLAALGARIRAA